MNEKTLNNRTTNAPAPATIRNGNDGGTDDDAHLRRCWGLQDCKGCLEQPDCSWCPFSWTCLPNSHGVQFLAPAWDENICPHWAERWEVRTRPLGCQVSTITTLTSLVTIASTLGCVLLVTLTVLAVKRVGRYGRENPGWWRALWDIDWGTRVENWRRYGIGAKKDGRNTGTGDHNGEREALLPSSRDT